MVAANAPLVVPEGLTIGDLANWTYACATDNHGECNGKLINPDPGCSDVERNLPCGCTICNHQKPRRGRPRKTPA